MAEAEDPTGGVVASTAEAVGAVFVVAEVVDSAAAEEHSAEGQAGDVRTVAGERMAAAEDLAVGRPAADLHSADLAEEVADLAADHLAADSRSEDSAVAARAWAAVLEAQDALRARRGRLRMAVGIRSEIARA